MDIAQYAFGIFYKWFKWARGDLNPGPPPRKGGVLTGLDDGPAQASLIIEICWGFIDCEMLGL